MRPTKLFHVICVLIFFTLAIVRPVSANEPMKFWVATTGGNGCCTWIAGEGEITPDTPTDFLQFITGVNNDGRYPKEIYLNSNGGDLIGGISLGLKFRNLGINTSVLKSVATNEFTKHVTVYYEEEGVCYSACAYAFLGGNDRRVLGEKSLGFHQFSRNLTTDQLITLISQKKLQETLEGDAQVYSGVIVKYLVEIGADPRILSIASHTGPDSMYFPTRKELQELNIVSSEGLSEWQLSPVKDGLVIVAQDLENSTELENVQIFCRKSDKARVIMLGVGSIPYDASYNDEYHFNAGFGGEINLKIDGYARDLNKREVEYSSQVSDRGYSKFYRVLLSSDEVNRLENAGEVAVGAYWSNVDGMHGFTSKINDDVRAKLKLVFKNCI